jgi:hypothetical protein
MEIVVLSRDVVHFACHLVAYAHLLHIQTVLAVLPFPSFLRNMLPLKLFPYTNTKQKAQTSAVHRLPWNVVFD